jgi:group I intron endonuclease
MAESTLPPCGVYRILCRPTGIVYVGSSSKLRRRLLSHTMLLRKGAHDNPRLQNAWNKHGSDSFEFTVLEAVDDPDYQLVREQYWIDKLQAADSKYGFNTAPVAGTRRGVPQPAHMAAISRALHLGKPKSAEHRAKISAGKMGQTKSTDEIERRSAKRRGKFHRADTIAKMCATRSGRPQPSKRALTFDVAEEIRRIRRDENLSQDLLAARFGCSRKSVREILAGNTYTAP